MAEQRGLEQALRDRAAVLADEWLLRARTILVNRTRHEFLATARLAQDQHRNFGAGHAIDQAEQATNGLTLADDRVI